MNYGYIIYVLSRTRLLIFLSCSLQIIHSIKNKHHIVNIVNESMLTSFTIIFTVCSLFPYKSQYYKLFRCGVNILLGINIMKSII